MRSNLRRRIAGFLLVALLSALALPVKGQEKVFEDLGLNVGGTSAAWSDFDNDGFVDLLVSGALWRNEGGGKFTQVKGLAIPGTGIWGDLNNDGKPDLYLSVHQIFRNDGARGFVHLSEAIGPRPMTNSNGATWGDFDGDSFLDLYIGGSELAGYQPDAIYRNRGDCTFELTWKTTDKNRPARGITAADFDEDGDLDIYVSNYRLEPNLLWRNNGKGVFEEVGNEFGVWGDGGLGAWGHTIGSSWGDLDNDGHMDLFVGNFSHPADYQDRPKFLRNMGPEGDFKFEDKTSEAGLHWQESYATPTLGDYDNDGDLDLVTDGRLFRNNTAPRHWLKVRLQGGGKINRDAIGAQVRLRLGEKTLTRQVEAATGEGEQNDPTLHFGLGDHGQEVELEIRWPQRLGVRKITTAVDRTVEVKFESSQ